METSAFVVLLAECLDGEFAYRVARHVFYVLSDSHFQFSIITLQLNLVWIERLLQQLFEVIFKVVLARIADGDIALHYSLNLLSLFRSELDERIVDLSRATA